MYIVHRVWNYGSLLDLQYMRALSSEALSGAFMSSLLGIIGVSVNLKMSSFSANLKKKKSRLFLVRAQKEGSSSVQYYYFIEPFVEEVFPLASRS